MPPFYDLECGNCNYERDDAYFSSQKAFDNAEKECPQCGETLSKKLAKFNIGKSLSSKNRKTAFKPSSFGVIELGEIELSCGKKIPYISKHTFKIKTTPKKNKLPKINLN